MNEVTVVCDRCKCTINGFENEHGTSGFYRTRNSPWTEFANPGENVICDSCMWKDERYLKMYPYMRQQIND